MALIVVFENVSQLTDVSDYRVGVYVNHTQVAGPFMVKGHTRDHGWEALVKQWAKSLKINHVDTRRAERARAEGKGETVRIGRTGS